MPYALSIILLTLSGEPDTPRPDFQRDVRPILSENCFRCHGFDESSRKADLRLDTRDGATRPVDSGAPAIVPGRPEASELLRRITASNPDERMPPDESGKQLTAREIDILRRWIADGAAYAAHWSFVPPRRQPPPTVTRADWPRNRIDAFVLARLEQEQLTPTRRAAPDRLLRRVSLDLIGLPPTPEEIDQFLQAAARDPEAAYEAEVERLLNSPHFGERMAIEWLDAARYADTNGYFGDRARQAWPWRDWVIQAFNRNLPFDEFTIEQLGGDLLPDATRDQRVATGFHRNAMANNETGIIDEEYRVEAVADRLDTTAAVWLGLTIGCAQCHDHKYDPISQREYYQLFAFLNQSVEPGLVTRDDPPPTLEVPTDEQAAALRRGQQALAEAERLFSAHAASLDADLAAWERVAPGELTPPPGEAVWQVDFDREIPADAVQGTALQTEPGIRGRAGKFDATQHLEMARPFDPDRPWTIAVWIRPTGSLSCIGSMIEPEGDRRGLELIWQKGRLQVNLVHTWGVSELTATTRDPVSSGDWHHLLVTYDGSRKATGLAVFVDGRAEALQVGRDALAGTLRCDEPFRIGRRDSGLGYYGLLDEFRVYQRAVAEPEVANWPGDERLLGILARPSTGRSAADQGLLRDAFIGRHGPTELRDAHRNLREARRTEKELREAIPTTLVMQDLAQPRKTFRLERGEYDRPGEEVQPGVPSALSSWSSDLPANRLGFARWLVAPQNPLTARVAVNRLWQICFGEGLVRTPNDFGSQGEPPTHPDLLDELANRFVTSGWDVKGLLRLMVTSATYCQDSKSSDELERRDPENRLWARGPRFRLSAELLRDQALSVSGLLSPRIGGPSVKPYQPEGLWEAVSYNAEDSYVPDTGEGLWRRSLYTYWKRQAPPPALLTFDANTREKCIVRRSRTNTPLQALVALNDPTYVEAARQLAASALTSRGSDAEKLRALFRRVVSRWPEDRELKVLHQLLERQRQTWSSAEMAARDLIRVGTSPARHESGPSELAAWTIVAHTILNLDETIARR